MLVVGLNYAPEPTGIGPYTAGMARFLADAGHSVHVVTGLPHYPQWSLPPGCPKRRQRQTIDGIPVTRVPHPVPARPSGRGRIGMEASFALRAATLRRPRPDVVIAVSPALLGVAAALRWRRPGRTAVGVVAQDLYSRAAVEAGLLTGPEAVATSLLERRWLRRADGVVAIHEKFRQSLDRLGVDSRRITTIRNWSHITPAEAERSTSRRELGWAPDEIIALHAGNMGAKQGLENLVDAARLATARRTRVRFVLLGAGHQRHHLEQLGRDIPSLQFLDPLPDGAFEAALAAADVLVLNERSGIAEMCVPSKLTSYFAAGRPVVAATSPRSAATAEVTASGGGITVEPQDPAALLDAIIGVAEDETRSAVMGLSGRRFARDHLHEDVARAAYVGWVEALAGGVAAPPRAGNHRRWRRRDRRPAAPPAVPSMTVVTP